MESCIWRMERRKMEQRNMEEGIWRKEYGVIHVYGVYGCRLSRESRVPGLGKW